MNEENKQWINDVSKTDYVDRLRKELKHNKMSQKEFAEKCEVLKQEDKIYIIKLKEEK